MSTEPEFGLPTIDQFLGSADDGVSTERRLREWLDQLYAVERERPRRIAGGHQDGWFRRRCRSDYRAMAPSARYLIAEASACQGAGDWFAELGMTRLSRRAMIRAEVCREIAASMEGSE